MSYRHMSDSSAHKGNDGQTIRLAGTHRTFTLSVLDGGPNENGGVSLIPDATVIQAAHYGDLGKPDEVHDLDYGGAIHVPGFGCMRIVKTDNPDWPRLVPMDGDRFYPRFEGFGSWKILDSHDDGKTIGWDTVSAACERLFGSKGITSRAQANAVAAYLSATVKG